MEERQGPSQHNKKRACPLRYVASQPCCCPPSARHCPAAVQAAGRATEDRNPPVSLHLGLMSSVGFSSEPQASHCVAVWEASCTMWFEAGPGI
jgi:hypothetical protein